MPLKPIFEKAPLTAVPFQPLSAGFVRMSDSSVLHELYAAVSADESVRALEPAFRMACIVCDKPMEEKTAGRIQTAIQTQKPDGSFDMPVCDAVAVLRAAWCVYEYESRKPLLDTIAQWFAWAARNWDYLMADDELWENPADLLELLENMYRVTGKAALLALCDRLSSETMAWSGVLNTISAQRPTNRIVTREELEAGFAKEAGSRDGYYSQFCRANHAEKLADGTRAASARGVYSGSATELHAAKNGWERLYRHHGAVCGGLTSDELLEGTSPAEAVSTAAVGAWAEALCKAAVHEDGGWTWDAIERILFNAMPAAVVDGKVSPFQLVNTVSGNVEASRCLKVSEDHAKRALYRLARGYAAAISHAVTVATDGMTVNMYLPGMYIVPVGEQLIAFSVNANQKGYTATIRCKQEIKADIRLRMPSWSRSIEVRINGQETALGNECKRNELSIERSWCDGDVITLEFDQLLRTQSGHHQGKYVMRGPLVMVYPADNANWAKSFVRAVECDGRVSAVLDAVEDWKLRAGEPADIPVLPAAQNNESTCSLVPYFKSTARITLFPGRKNG